MSMKICKDCGAEVSKSAKTCPKCGKKLKYSGMRIILGIAILIIGISIIASIGGNNTTTTGTDANQSVQQEKITLDKFNKIKTGMTYQEVVDIIGEEGTVLSESDIGDSKYKTTMYYWYAKNGISNANVTIQGGKVISKAQIGLE